MIAQLAVAAAVYAIDKPYSYRVPEGMQVQPGLRVLVPFGRGNRRSEAVVLALQDTAQRDLKVIERALDDAPILSQAQLQLAAFMKERYFCTFYEAVKAILPAGLLVCGEEDPDARARRAGQAAARHGQFRRGPARAAAAGIRRQRAGAHAPPAVFVPAGL